MLNYEVWPFVGLISDFNSLLSRHTLRKQFYEQLILTEENGVYKQRILFIIAKLKHSLLLLTVSIDYICFDLKLKEDPGSLLDGCMTDKPVIVSPAVTLNFLVVQNL